MSSPLALALPIAILVGGVAGCKDDYPAERCVEGQGFDLSAEGIPRRGEADDLATVTVFGDLQCVYSTAMMLKLWAFFDRIEQDESCAGAQLLFRHLPLDIHPRSHAAAHATAAAHFQGDDAFWSLYWQLAVASDLSDQAILEHADEAGLDLEQFEHALDDGSAEAVVERDLALADEIGCVGSPTVLICGIIVPAVADDVTDNLEYLLCD